MEPTLIRRCELVQYDKLYEMVHSDECPTCLSGAHVDPCPDCGASWKRLH